MKNSVLILAIFLLPFMAIKAQDPQKVKETVRELSKDIYCGRGITNEGDKKAAAWISGQFAQIGLKKWGDNYYQYFSVSGNTFPGNLEVRFDNRLLKPAEDFYLRLSCPDTTAGYGIIKLYDYYYSANRILSLLDEELKEKCLVMDMDYLMALNEPDTLFRKLLKKRTGAMIFLSSHPVRYYSIHGNRVFYRPVLDMPRSAFDTTAKTIKITAETEYKKDYQTQNVIGYIEGKTKKDEYIVISGHYDHIGMMGKDTYFPGADDNASAIGVLLEMARYFSKPGNAPERTLIFAAFGSEETGLVGSEWFVNHCPVDTSKIKMVINFDMVAFGKDSFIVYNGIEQPAVVKSLNAICKNKNLPFVYVARENIPMSDHHPFVEKGIPAVFITSGAEASPDYHTVKDNYERASFYNIKELMISVIEFIKVLS